ncbi:MipA/OmpV family protein [Rheinheimera sp.]|uniref:MipA/OmpV family protein n=1 Tax=Rheinheimera sp. TaxID=1869214 RepID=UPI002FDDB1DE
MRLLLVLACSLPLWAWGNECQQETNATAGQCTEPGQWHFALAAGAGHRSNPLNGGHNFPLWLIPDLSYYGKHWFFDNGTLGYNLQLNSALQLSLVSRLNEERGYFRRADASNMFSQSLVSEMGLAGPVQKMATAPELSIDNLAKRPTAVDGGLQLDWFLPNMQLRANWWHDISGQYHGQHASVSVSTGWQSSFGHWQLSSSLLWKNADLINTYYGVTEQQYFSSYYQTGSSWQPELKLSWSYPLTPDWSALAFYRHRFLDDAMTNSPLVNEGHIRSWFVGVTYQFF